MADPKNQTQPQTGSVDKTNEKSNKNQLETIFKWIFVVFLLLHIGVIVYAFLNGNPSSLTQPYDSDHRPCGVGELADYPYIYFTAPTDKTLWKTVCVKECPAEDQKKGELLCAPTQATPNCKTNISPTDSSKRTLVYESQEFQGIVCLPKSIKYYQSIAPSLDVEGLVQTVGDIQKSKYVILGSVVATVLFLFLYVKLQSQHRKNASASGQNVSIPANNSHASGNNAQASIQNSQATNAIFSSQNVFSAQVICNLLVLIILAVFAILKATEEQKTLELTEDQVTIEDADQLKEIQQGKTHDPIWYWAALVVCGTFIFYYLYSLFPILWEKKYRQDFFQDLDKLSNISYQFFQDESVDIEQLPFFQAITSIVYIGIWLYTALELYSCGEVVHEEKSLPFGQFKFNEATKYIAIFHIFSLVWVIAFIINIGKLYLVESADAFFLKYEDSKKDSNLGTWLTISQARFHIGSVALMSLIQITVGFIQYLPFSSNFQFYNYIVSARKETLYYLIKSNTTTYDKIVKLKGRASTKDLELKDNAGNNFFEAGKEFLADQKTDLFNKKKNVNSSSSNNIKFEEAYNNSEKYGDFLQFTVSLWISLFITFTCYWILNSNEAINSPVISLGIIFSFSIVVSNIITGVIGASMDQFLLSYFLQKSKQIECSEKTEYPDLVKKQFDQNKSTIKTFKDDKA